MYGDHYTEFGLSAADRPKLARGAAHTTFRAEKCIRATQTFKNRKNHENRENREKSQKSEKREKSQKRKKLKNHKNRKTYAPTCVGT